MTRKLPKEDRENQILDVATRLFVERGYEGVSMETIASEAGLTKGGLYHHFAGKEDLLRRANDRFTEPILAMLERAATAPSVADGIRAYLREYIGFWLGHRVELSFVVLCMVKALTEPDKWPLYAEYGQSMSQALGAVFSGGIASGEFREHDPEAHALVLFAAVDGLLGYAAMDPDLTPERICAAVERVVLDPILKGEV